MLRRHFLGSVPAAPALLASLQAAISKLDLISTHEHLLSEAERLAERPNFFTLASHYLADDFASAGRPAGPLRDWSDFEPWWPLCRLTGYGQAFALAMRELYGEAELTAAALPRLEAAIANATRPGLYRRVLRERGRFRYAILDDFWHGDPVRPDPEFFLLARKLDWFCSAARASDIRRMEEVTGVAIHSARDLCSAATRRLEQSLSAGLVALKTTLSYSRPLHFENPSPEEAQADFDLLMRQDQPRPPHRLSDFVFHHVLQFAESRRLPVQVHTGLQAGNANSLEASRPTLLNNLFLRYPRLRFDLFHLGWPWVEESAALAKMFPNVWIDFCWAHVVSPPAARAALHLLLETVPANKILGFGGDYRYVELSYAHSVMARRNIAQVLAEKVQAGLCTEPQAVELARRLLSENAAALFPRPA